MAEHLSPNDGSAKDGEITCANVVFLIFFLRGS